MTDTLPTNDENSTDSPPPCLPAGRLDGGG